jgi:hypothetical protein
MRKRSRRKSDNARQLLAEIRTLRKTLRKLVEKLERDHRKTPYSQRFPDKEKRQFRRNSNPTRETPHP